MNEMKSLKISAFSIALGLCSTFTQAQTQTVTEAWKFNSGAGASSSIRSIALDAFGNVFETGSTGTTTHPWDWTTQMFSPTGTRRWVVSYNGPSNNIDLASAIVLDARGNSYVTGYGLDVGCRTAKYDADGIELWVVSKTGQCASAAIDLDGNIVVTGVTHDNVWRRDTDMSQHFMTIKYTPDGGELWTRTYAGAAAGSVDRAYKVAVDRGGNVFVAGTTMSDDLTRVLFAVVKYDSAGTELWVKRLNTPSTTFAPSMTLDAVGNVIVAGTVDVNDATNTAVASDIVVAKIDTNGSLIWQTLWYHNPGDFFDNAASVSVDAAGDVIVTGYVDGESLFIGAKMAVVKFAGYTGAYQWENTFGGGALPGRGFSVISDGEGNSYAAGRLGSDGKIFKFNSVGAQIWSATYPTALFNALALDGKGCLVAAGGSSSGNITVKLCQQGALVCN